MTTIVIEPELKTLLKRLKLSRMLDTLNERLANARQNKQPHQDFLMLLLSDEVSRRDTAAVTLRAQRLISTLTPASNAGIARRLSNTTRSCSTNSSRCASLKLESTWQSWVLSASARPLWPRLWGTLPVDGGTRFCPYAPTTCSRTFDTLDWKQNRGPCSRKPT